MAIVPMVNNEETVTSNIYNPKERKGTPNYLHNFVRIVRLQNMYTNKDAKK